MISLKIHRGDHLCLMGPQRYRRSRDGNYIVYEFLMSELGGEELYLETGSLPMLVLTPAACYPPDRTTTWQRNPQ
jgi:hypothetical protein